MASNFEKLQTLLSELFQLDQADLDFGIYRIMNQKRGEITRFLDKELLPQVKASFAQYQPADRRALEERLEQARQAAITAGFDPEQSPKVKEIRDQMASFSVDITALENEVYSHLYSFFRRYYESGDFISMRRYKEGVYAIPYEGEEVKLHWANADQYYIKTAEYFRDYTFKLPSGRLAHFKIVEAETERDNVKAADEKDRRFMLAGETPAQVVDGEFVMRFEYRADAEKRDQMALNTLAVETIRANTPADWIADLFAPAPTESNPRLALLEKRLADYTARNTFDYFIHKDLRGFLRRELDFYIKNEVMHLDDVESETAPRVEQYLSKIKALRSIAHKIIEFLAQIEDFQKKLWLKKKFVVETNYCITLDRVPEELYPEIAVNEAQQEEWVRLFAIDEIKGDLVTPGYSSPLSIDFLKNNPYLVVDTLFFTHNFKARLLANFENIDEQIDGLLIHGENSQALRLLSEHYSGQIKNIYIDPPFNTGGTSFIYKNGFRHSSWYSMMYNAISNSVNLLQEDGVFICAIDDFEVQELSLVTDIVFGRDGRLGVLAIETKPSGRTNDNFLATSHEYYLCYSKNPEQAQITFFELSDEQVNQYSESDGHSAYKWRDFMRTGGFSTPQERPNSYYPIYYEPASNRISTEPFSGSVPVLPIDSSGRQRVWRKTIPSLNVHIEAGDIQIKKAPSGEYKVYIKDRIKKGVRPKSIWVGSQYDASSHGTKLLKQMFGPEPPFTFPKSLYAVKDAIRMATDESEPNIIVDFFAGSGTTGHSIIELNKQDEGQRKFILVEMGNHFYTVLKPRIEKATYSKDWRDGKPISREGSSQFFKYLRIESFEDTLNNLTVRRKEEQQLALAQSPSFRESYLLSYMLEAESQGSLLNIESFRHPFSYQLNIATGTVGESKPTTIDLVETFNYLVGLRVQTMQIIRSFRVVTGLTPEGERTLIIWRDLDEKDNAALEEFFRKQDYNPRDMEFDLIYVNGDNNLENLRRPDETWKVRLIEEEFLRRMFDTEGM